MISKFRLGVKSLMWEVAVVVTTALLLCVPAGYENSAFAKGAFLTGFITSLAWSLVALYILEGRRSLKIFFYTIICLLFFIETICYVLLGSRFNGNILILILQTDAQETLEFVNSYLISWQFFFICLSGGLLLYLLIRWLAKSKIELLMQSKVGLIFSIPAIMLGFAIPFVELPVTVGDNTILGVYRSIQFAKDMHSDVNNFEVMIDKICVDKEQCLSNPPLVILLIGESYNKWHSQLYGYNVKTSPKLACEKNLIVFNDAHTPVCYTYGAMRYIFTLKSCDRTNNDTLQYVLFPAVFKKAGFKVAYFDNQYTRSKGGAADYGCAYFLSPKYINDNCFDVRNSVIKEFDGDFVDYCKPFLLKNGKSLNIIHLKGQHLEAKKRYPKEYAFFLLQIFLGMI